jgi:hypothetical protein
MMKLSNFGFWLNDSASRRTGLVFFRKKHDFSAIALAFSFASATSAAPCACFAVKKAVP